MSPLTSEQLAEYLIRSADEAFPKGDAIEVITVAMWMLLLKRAADQPERHRIFGRETLRTIMESGYSDEVLNRLLEEAIRESSQIIGVEPGDYRLSWNLKPAQIRRFAILIDRIFLGDDNLEFPDTIGAAYDRFLAQMTSMTGKLGGVISTPESVTELMVRITSPRAGKSVCDPFSPQPATLCEILTVTSPRSTCSAKNHPSRFGSSRS